MLVDKNGNPLIAKEAHYPSIPFTRISTGNGATTRRRQTTDRDTFGPFTSFSGREYVKASDNVDWKLTFLNEDKLSRKNPSDLLDTLLLSSPDLSRARTNMEELINTGFSLTVKEDGPEAEAAQEILDEALEQMNSLGTSMKEKINKWIYSMFIKGAIYSECIFDGEEGEERFIDIRVLDGFRVAYRETENAERGQYQELGEVRDGNFYPFQNDLVQYTAINPTDNNPLGVPMVGSAIYPIIFLMGVMKSLRQVVECQAWPQGLITIDAEKKWKSIPNSDNVNIDADQFQADLVTQTQNIESEWNNADKGQIFVAGAEVGYEIVGAMGGADISAVKMIQDIMNQWIVKATKQFPISFGLAEGQALSTNSDQFAELLARQTDHYQGSLEDHLNIHFTQILRNEGNLSTPIFRFKRFNALVEKQRAERANEKQQFLSGLLKDRIITQQQYLSAIRDPESLDNLADLLEEDLPEELIMEDPNAEEQVLSEQTSGTQPQNETA